MLTGGATTFWTTGVNSGAFALTVQGKALPLELLMVLRLKLELIVLTLLFKSLMRPIVPDIFQLMEQDK